MDNDEGSILSGLAGWAVYGYVMYQHYGLVWAGVALILPTLALVAYVYLLFFSETGKAERHNKRCGFHEGQRFIQHAKYSTRECVYVRPGSIKDWHWVRIGQGRGVEVIAKTWELEPAPLPKFFV